MNTTKAEETKPVAFLEIPVIDWENIRKSEGFKNISSYLVYFLFVAYFSLIFYISSKDESALDNTKNTLYLLSVIIPLVVFAHFIFSKIGGKQYFIILAVFTIFISLFLLRSAIPSFDKIINEIMLYFTAYKRVPTISDETSFLVSLSLKFLLIVIIILFLSIIFNVFFDESFRQKGKLSVLLYAIFFIPCLVSDYFNYLFNEVRTTPFVVFSLIFFEFLLVLLYIYVPKWLSKIVLTNSIQIVGDPVQLYRKKHVGRTEDFYNTTKDMKEIELAFPSYVENEGVVQKEFFFLKNYSLSMWITLNTPTFSKDTECMILRIGSDTGSDADPDNPRLGAPYIGCKGSKLRVVFSNNVLTQDKTAIDAEKLYAVSSEFDVPFQTWNFFVFNYHDNQVDLFINGKLTDTKSLASFLPIYHKDQKFSVGSDSNLLHGAVCDIRIQPDMLNQTQISQTYNLLKLKNPPVNNII